MGDGSIRARLLASRAAIRKGRRKLGAAVFDAWLGDPLFDARPAQLSPAGDWSTWLILAGRGFGKTFAGSLWAHEMAQAHDGARIALVAATEREARGVMVEGPAGLLALAPLGHAPGFAPSLGRVSWPNGSIGTIVSAAEPESLRGPQFDFAWGDEAAKWHAGEAVLAQLRLGLRLGERPRLLLTTTPRPHKWLKALAGESSTVVTHGRTHDNAANLAPGFVDAMEAAFGATRFGRQELEGAFVDDIEGALWTRDGLEACRVRAAPGTTRVVIGVDPPAEAGGDACGIVVVALGEDGRGHVLADASVGGLDPTGWARAVAVAAEVWAADKVVAEVNQGGAMVETVLRAARVTLPIVKVRATRGKVARAEPVAALYDAGRVRHVGGFPELEDELCGLLAGGRYVGPGRSPDRADALVWALAELLLGNKGEPGVRVV